MSVNVPSVRLLVLHLEDDANDAELVRASLESDGIACDVLRVETQAFFEAGLARADLDLILSDKSLPSYDGLSALALARERRPDVPFIFVSGTLGEEVAIESLKNGATDYVLKQRLARLPHVTRRALREVAEQRQRRLADAALHRRLAELEAINRALTALRSAESVDSIVSILLDETLAVIDSTSASVWLYDTTHDDLRLSMQRGADSPWPESLPPGEGIPGIVLLSGRHYTSRDFKSDEQLSETARASMPEGVGGVWVPLRDATELIGLLFVAVAGSRDLAREEISLLTTLSEIAGNAIRRDRTHRQTVLQVERLAAQRQIDMTINASLNLRMTLNVLLQQLADQLRVDAADVLLLNPHSQMLEYAAGRGLRSRSPENTRFRLGEGYAGRVALERRMLAAPDARSPADAPVSLLAAEGFVAYYGVPLIAKGQVKGVLEVFNRTALDPDPEWLDFFEALAEQAAIAVDSVQLLDALQRTNTELSLAYDTTIEGWSQALDLRDKETEGHTQRVTAMTLRLAREFKMSDAELVHLRRGALLHDIGKMGVPDSILLKPGALSDDEWTLMRRHPVYAYDLLSSIGFLRPALAIPHSHHEKWDGTGYPRGLKGEQIPLAARIFAIVDVWDALRSDRPYRRAWPADKARDYIRAQAGQHFDPAVAAEFLGLDFRDAR